MLIALTRQGCLNTRYAYSRACFPRSRSVHMCMYLTCRWYIQTHIRTHNRKNARTHTHAHTHTHSHTHTQAAVINASNNADIRSHPSFPDMRFHWLLCQDILKEGKSPQVAHVVFHQVFCKQCLTHAQGCKQRLLKRCELLPDSKRWEKH